MTQEDRHVVIIGGGFTGAAVAWHLARHPDAPPVTVIEPRPTLGAGLAYSTADPAHRINVPAGRMTMRTDRPGDMDDWLRRSGRMRSEWLTPDGAAYPQRAEVARYMADALAPMLASGAVRHRRIAAAGLARAADGRLAVTLQDGGVLHAAQVVIATSHPPPGLPSALSGLADDPRLIADPTDAAAITQAARCGEVLILGTGLTSADVIASLDRQGFRGRITALSRRGLRSRGHDYDHPGSAQDFAADPQPSARAVLRRVRQALRRDQAAGLPWQATMDALRRDAPSVWGALDAREQARLVARLRVWWDVHRFRVAPQVEAVMDRMIAEGRLSIEAGRLLEARSDGSRLALRVTRRGGAARQILVDRLILTTGPGHDRILDSNPLLRDAARNGLVAADPLKLGLAVTQTCRALGPEGRPVPGLWVAGPLARGHVGELMGIPEVTAHAEAVAARLAAC